MTDRILRRDFLQGAAALAAVSTGTRIFAMSGLSPQDAITYDARSLSLHGKRTLLIAGEMHYSRSLRATWPAILDRSKALGINCVATYVFWNVHEPEKNVYDFSGERDLGHFLRLCQERNLSVFLRTGPYCCAEWNFGGFPPYLRDEPGITTRTMSEPYLNRVEKYFERLAEEVRPYLATAGGPIILIQVENEYGHVANRYGAAGQEYLRWIVQLAQRVGFTGVPTTTCEGGADGSIETANGSAISPQRAAQLQTEHRDAPLIWSELYPAWYQIWGGKAVVPRDPREIALVILQFLAEGGSGWNYYMWHGGTNFGRSSSYLQTTSYDYHAPLDEYGRLTLLGAYLGRLHGVLHDHAAVLLEGTRSEKLEPSGLRRVTWSLGQQKLELLLPRARGIASGSKTESVPTPAQLFDAKGRSLFSTHDSFAACQSLWHEGPWKDVATDFAWQSWAEPFPSNRPGDAVLNPEPVEQLSLTKDRTDYCWYSTTLMTASSSERDLLVPFGGDFFYIFLDGKFVAQTATPLLEDRGPIAPEEPAHPRVAANPRVMEVRGFRQQFRLPAVAPGKHRLDIFATAIGMIKEDGQIDGPMNMERKGIWEGVLLNGTRLSNWQMRPFLIGEISNIVQQSSTFNWTGLGKPRRLAWYRTSFRLPSTQLTADADFRLSAQGLGKGLLYLNGNLLGRHWLVQGPDGKPTQPDYHVPGKWLASSNQLIIFEEQDVSPDSVRLQIRQHSA